MKDPSSTPSTTTDTSRETGSQSPQSQRGSAQDYEQFSKGEVTKDAGEYDYDRSGEILGNAGHARDEGI